MTVELEEGLVGIIADLHGNLTALDGVLANGRDRGVLRWLVLGDVVAMGPQPSAVLDRLDQLDVVAAIAGNTERYVLTDDRPDPTPTQVIADPSKLPTFAEVAATFAWTRGHLTATGHLDHIRNYEPDAVFSLPDGTRIRAVHASQRSDEGVGIHPDMSVEHRRSFFPDPQAQVVLGGHTHEPTDIVVDGIRFVNPGSVSNHHRNNHAQYATLNIESNTHRFDLHSVAYDKQRTVDAIRASGIPGAEFLLRSYFPNIVR